jgi:acetyl-CoA acyltransferase
MMGFNLSPHPVWDSQAVEDYINVGLAAERVARQFGVTREEQDRFAFANHCKARAAEKMAGWRRRLRRLSMMEPRGRGWLRPRYDAGKACRVEDRLSRRRDRAAASSSPMTDGATAVLVCSAAFGLKAAIKSNRGR